MTEFTKLELAVIQWMAERLPIANLRAQIEAATVIQRELTGVGSFTSLAISSGVPSIQCSSPIMGPVIESPGIEHGGSALLILDDAGHIATLEICANGSRFDETVEAFVLNAWE